MHHTVGSVRRHCDHTARPENATRGLLTRASSTTPQTTPLSACARVCDLGARRVLAFPAARPAPANVGHVQPAHTCLIHSCPRRFSFDSLSTHFQFSARSRRENIPHHARRTVVTAITVRCGEWGWWWWHQSWLIPRRRTRGDDGAGTCRG